MVDSDAIGPSGANELLSLVPRLHFILTTRVDLGQGRAHAFSHDYAVLLYQGL